MKITTLITDLFAAIERLIPDYMKDPADARISNGNVAVCIIDESGQVHGKMFGTYKPRLRQSFRVAWTKASQVWLTGVKTGEYEKMVFNGEVEENANGIENPDLIGWEGGQPLTLANGKNYQ
jgi:glc operon protein GlcG